MNRHTPPDDTARSPGLPESSSAEDNASRRMPAQAIPDIARLNESLRQFGNIFESIGDCIELVSLDGHIIDINRAGCERIGHAREEVAGHALAEFITPEYAALVPQRIALIRERGHATFESARRHGNGTVIPIEVSAGITEAGGQPVILSISRDITERVASREALQKLNDDLSATLQAIPDLLFELDQDGRYRGIWANNETLLARQKELLLDRTVSEMLPPQAAAIIMEALREAGEKGHAAGHTLCLDLPQGKKWFELSVAAKPRSGTSARHFMMLSRDITGRMQTEAELHDNHAKLNGLYTLSPMGIALTDMQGHYIEFNDAFRNICGYTREELNRLDYWELTPREYAEEEDRQLELLRTRGRYGPYEKEYIRKDGSRIPLRLTGVLIQGSDGQSYIWSLVEDITERKQAEEALRLSLSEYGELVRRIPVGIYKLRRKVDRSVRFDYVSPRWCEMNGLTEEEVKRDVAKAVQVIHPEDRENFLSQYENPASTLTWEGRVCTPDGETRWMHIEARTTCLENGDTLWDGIQYDITSRRATEDALRITASVFETTHEAILITDADNLITDVNAAFSRITGYNREEVLGKNPKLLSSGRHDAEFYAAMWQSLNRYRSWRGEIWNRRKSGERYAELLSISVLCDDNGKPQRYVGVFSDITHIKAHEAELSRIAHYDALTGVPNRVLLADRMRQAIAQTARERNMMAVCYLDLDGFKPVNDAFGHKAGDQVLIEISRRIGSTIRGGDTVARLGGDEFVMLLLGLQEAEECAATLKRVLSAINQPVSIGGQTITLSASIGVSLYPLDNEDPDTLLRHADQAMYVAKQSGKNRLYLYDPTLEQISRNRQTLMQSVRQAMRDGQFDLHYQPKINLRTKQLVGAEALIRWQHPERGLLPPSEFLRLIENSDLDIELGDWVISAALDQIAHWQQAGLDIEVSVNISAHHLESEGFTEKLRRQLARHSGSQPARLQIEILETVALGDAVIVSQIIENCRELGVRFSLDDFGTGYSSLSYLSSLPVGVLKIDQTFVRDMLEDKGDMAIVHGVIALAKAFEREIVAEGIETDAHYRALLGMGCEIGQGYGIARPMPAAEMAAWKVPRARRPAPPRTSRS